jgi:hypothetical protein
MRIYIPRNAFTPESLPPATCRRPARTPGGINLIASLLVAVVVGCISPSTMLAGETVPVTSTLDLQHPGAEIGTNFAGLSFEASLLLPGTNGLRYFRPDNQPLVQLFHMLGIRSLRLGGNTSDRDATRLPGPADWDSLFAFARVAQVKVIYCLHLYRGDSQVAVRTVKYITDHYAPWVEAFSIGQEPSSYPLITVNRRPVSEYTNPPAVKYSFSAYAQEWKQFADAITAANPSVKFGGPGVHDNPEWTREFIAGFGCSNHVALITEHLYPGGNGATVPTPEIGRGQMLGKDFVKTYQKLYDGFVPMAVTNRLPYRLEEVNSYYNSGATNVSNTFASALWGLDFMYWWAQHGAAGLNFHTGDRVAAGPTLQPCKYTAFFSTTTGFVICPLGYSLKAFSLGSHGRMVGASTLNPDSLNLSLYAVLGNDQNVYVTAINKESGPQARSADLTLQADSRDFTSAESMGLAVPGNDIAAIQGQTLGGSEIKEDLRWSGKWAPLTSPKSNCLPQGALKMEIPPASAILIRLKPNRGSELSGK